MRLEQFQIPNPLSNEHRPDQLAGIVPLSTIRGKDPIPQELFPFQVELFAFAIVGELGSQDSFYVLWIGGEDDSDGS